jgi:PBP1b-binding outer membrane lipoprotein LpoB
MSEGNDEKGFIIKDKRHFDETGDVREEEVEKKEEKRPEEKPEPKEEAKQKIEGAETEAEESYTLPEMNFASFIFSLHTSALFHFGDLPDPVSNEKMKNLTAAKQTIEILDMLKEKTSGNLDENEEKLLEGILYELKMRFIRESDKP